MAASASRRWSRSAVSLAWTRPRCRSGKVKCASSVIAPNSGMPMRANPGAINAACRGLATRFRITPAIETSSR